MKKIYIYGAGGFGYEVYNWLQDLKKIDSEIKFMGFLVDTQYYSTAQENLENFSVQTGENWSPSKGDHVVVAVADINGRVAICAQLKKKGVKFYNLVHPSVLLGSDIIMGEGNIVCPNCVLTTKISIGDFNHINVATTIGHNVSIGSYNVFSAQNDITGHVSVRDKNFFGSRVSIAPKKKVGSGNKISAGSVLFRDVKNDTLVMGNPAKMYI
jgi:sugar O-acyltransferase (sialic acid O-acetyltransferase NeuD family)